MYSIRPSRPAKPKDESFISPEEHEAIQQARQADGIITPERLEEMMETAKMYANFPCGITLNEISAKDIYAALQELKERRENQ